MKCAMMSFARLGSNCDPGGLFLEFGLETRDKASLLVMGRYDIGPSNSKLLNLAKVQG